LLLIASRKGAVMIRLKFSGFQDAHSITLGPEPGFRVSGNFLRAMPAGAVLGAYQKHQWCVKGRYFSRYDCLDPCILYFADLEGTTTPTFGPFDALHVADGTMYTDELFAKFVDESLLWHSFKLETWWPNLIIASPDQRP
jgi:hypothetical protein